MNVSFVNSTPSVEIFVPINQSTLFVNEDANCVNAMLANAIGDVV